MKNLNLDIRTISAVIFCYSVFFLGMAIIVPAASIAVTVALRDPRPVAKFLYDSFYSRDFLKS